MAKNDKSSPTPLDFENFSIRALEWKAQKIFEHGNSRKTDDILFSDLDAYESLDKTYINQINTLNTNSFQPVHNKIYFFEISDFEIQ